MILRVIKSESFIFVLGKYFAYSLQFVISLLAAKKLGAYLFGIYGFLILLLQYLSYTNFGINYALNVILATEKNLNEELKINIVSASFSITIVISLSLIIIGLIAYSCGFVDLLKKYLVDEYFFIIILIAIVQYFILIFLNLFRIYGKLNEINFNIIIIPFFQFIILFFFEGKDLLWALLTSMFVGNFFSFLIYFINSPVQINIKINNNNLLIKNILKRGILLLFYNLSFYFIIIIARSLVSYYYKVDEFAQFSFANSLSNAIIMLLGSLVFLFYPNLLNRFSKLKNKNETILLIEKIRRIYMNLTSLIVFGSIIFAPIIFWLVPQFKDSFSSFRFLLISQLLISIGFGYSTFLIQRKMEKQLTLIGFSAVLIVFISGIIFANYLNFQYESIAISIIIGVICYNIGAIYQGNKYTQQFKSKTMLFVYIFNYKYILPIIMLIFMGDFSKNNFYYSIFTIIFYMILNYKDLDYTIKIGFRLMSENKSFII